MMIPHFDRVENNVGKGNSLKLVKLTRFYCILENIVGKMRRQFLFSPPPFSKAPSIDTFTWDCLLKIELYIDPYRLVQKSLLKIVPQISSVFESGSVKIGFIF